MDATRQANVGRCLVRDEGFHPQGASHQSRPCGTTRQIPQSRKSVGSLYRMVLQDKLTTKLATSLASPLAATLASTLASVLAGTLASSLASTLASTWASRKPFNSSPPAPHSTCQCQCHLLELLLERLLGRLLGYLLGHRLGHLLWQTMFLVLASFQGIQVLGAHMYFGLQKSS